MVDVFMYKRDLLELGFDGPSVIDFGSINAIGIIYETLSTELIEGWFEI